MAAYAASTNVALADALHGCYTSFGCKHTNHIPLVKAFLRYPKEHPSQTYISQPCFNRNPVLASVVLVPPPLGGSSQVWRVLLTKISVGISARPPTSVRVDDDPFDCSNIKTKKQALLLHGKKLKATKVS